jgi:hypothetical protein
LPQYVQQELQQCKYARGLQLETRKAEAEGKLRAQRLEADKAALGEQVQRLQQQLKEADPEQRHATLQQQVEELEGKVGCCRSCSPRALAQQ